ncbi:MAG: dTDP-4-dehydrorhamnose reductase [Candidatus Endonucleobacter bathymodioli]|uniref:dTDP-4-dehydrorhamnose reductase n=1 Tax=Candidatus Endonucleibacter bathymodioli TaxID=539814 RepID=A0AA90P2Y3_9GAMM|nr:dTDP-4-dehydrorhamnose reductase [Candidatus Endonucleobacter bathymodioli]
MKVLITGADGQVGRELVEMGRLLSYEIIEADREVLDITDSGAVRSFCENIRPEAIINAAAYTAVDDAELEPELAFLVNSEAVKYLASAAKELQIPLLHISTDYVFDGAKPEHYNEEDSTSPINVYGRSKRQGEIYLVESGAHYFILRTSWVFGRHGSNFVKTMMRLAKDRDELSVINDQFGGPTSAIDISAALYKALAVILKDPTLSGIYHYSGAPEVSWFEFAGEIIKMGVETGKISDPPIIKPITSDEYPVAATRPKNSRLNCARFSRVFNEASPSWREQLLGVI